MPISPPVAASGSRAPERKRRIPQAVRDACLMMIEEAADFITAANAKGLRPDTMRRWLHRPEVISFLRRERAAFRQAVCSANEKVLAQIRDKADGNAIARVNAIRVLEGMDADDSTRRGGDAVMPGITIQLIQAPIPTPQVGGPLIDAVAQPAHHRLPGSG